MLTRPDAGPGCGWMRRLDATLPQLEGRRRGVWMAAWLVGILLVTQAVNYAYRFAPAQPRESDFRIAGLPLYAQGERPRAIVAVGAYPVGVVAVGGLAVGAVAIGGMAVGGIALSGISMGIFAIGGLALGGWAAGGGAVGYHAFGGLAVGGYAYSGGGVALGHYVASGRQKEKLW